MHAKMTFSDDCAVWYSIMEREKKLSILYQKRGRATQFANKADRDKWLQREIDEYERVLSSNLTQVAIYIYYFINCDLLKSLNVFSPCLDADRLLDAVHLYLPFFLVRICAKNSLNSSFWRGVCRVSKSLALREAVGFVVFTFFIFS